MHPQCNIPREIECVAIDLMAFVSTINTGVYPIHGRRPARVQFLHFGFLPLGLSILTPNQLPDVIRVAYAIIALAGVLLGFTVYS
jgi:hypothetical protein